MVKYFLFLSLFLWSLTSSVFGRNFDPDQAYQDYLRNYNQYRQTREKYAIAKTLTKTRQMLEKRSETFRSYLIFVRLNLAKTTRIIGYPTNVLYMKLDKITKILSNAKITVKKEPLKKEIKPAGIIRSDHNKSTKNWENSLRKWWIKN